MTSSFQIVLALKSTIAWFDLTNRQKCKHNNATKSCFSFITSLVATPTMFLTLQKAVLTELDSA